MWQESLESKGCINFARFGAIYKQELTGSVKVSMNHIGILASGNGSNAQRIVEYFNGRDDVCVSVILSNRNDAYVLERATKLGIPSATFGRKEFYESSEVLDILNEYDVDFVVLAGFLWLVPESLIKAFPDRILNIHPALLPKFGGKGMYGMRVHEAVVAAKEPLTGITIHVVNRNYDEGDIVFQAECNVESTDTAEDVAKKIHELEYKFFPVIIEKILLHNSTI